MGTTDTKLHLNEKTEFLPAEEEFLTVQLPGERLRVPVRRVINTDTVFVLIDKPPLAKGHAFKMGDVLVARRKQTPLGEVWEIVDESREPAAGGPR